MKEIKLKKGEYVRIKGFVTMYAPSGNKKKDGQWIGGSSWTTKNPLIRIGRCKHKPLRVLWTKNTDIFGKYKEGEKKRTYWKNRIVCSDCGYIIKLGKELTESRRKTN